MEVESARLWIVNIWFGFAERVEGEGDGWFGLVWLTRPHRDDPRDHLRDQRAFGGLCLEIGGGWRRVVAA